MEAFGFDKSLKKDRILGVVSAPRESRGCRGGGGAAEVMRQLDTDFNH